ncbi:MAG: cytochrome c/FTR1 family iron permease [Elusimicrobia bacterium]|nr:cytochrome c/FTR1 family iron permease [Elusimicrobiota bacterium]
MAFQVRVIAAALALSAAGVLNAGGEAMGERVKRIAFTFNIASLEYAEGVAEGRIINPVEYQEASEFIAQAREQLARAVVDAGLSDFESSSLLKDAAKLQDMIRTKASPAAVRGLTEAVNLNLSRVFGIDVRPLPQKSPSLAGGKKIFHLQCAICHGDQGDGRGPAAPGVEPKPADFGGDRLRSLTPSALWQVTTLGVEGTAMISWADRLNEQERWDVVSYLWQLTAQPALLARGREIVSSLNTRLPDKFADKDFWAQTSDEEAAKLFANFIPGAKEGNDALALARYLRLGSAGHGEAAALAAGSAGETQTPPWALFVQSLTIILREGMEAILILAAIIAYLRRSGNAGKVRHVVHGALLAVAASVATAWVMEQVFGASKLDQEALEGITMLVAVAVLFYVSNWLISKIETRRWQNFIQDKVAGALSSRNITALSLAAFLAVYREGFETVLFYKALHGLSAQAGPAPLWSGFLAGCALLAVLFLIIERLGYRLALKQFFMGTSAFLFLMAFSFMGRGIAELQEAGWLPSSSGAWLPKIPFLGIYPTLETTMGQLLVLAALAASVIYVFYIEPNRRFRHLASREPVAKELEPSVKA